MTVYSYDIFFKLHVKYIIAKFFINMQIQGQQPHQWAHFHVAGLMHTWQTSYLGPVIQTNEVVS